VVGGIEMAPVEPRMEGHIKPHAPDRAGRHSTSLAHLMKKIREEIEGEERPLLLPADVYCFDIPMAIFIK
jgi:hypothetical protein